MQVNVIDMNQYRMITDEREGIIGDGQKTTEVT